MNAQSYEGFVLYNEKCKSQALGIVSNTPQSQAIENHFRPDIEAMLIGIEDKRFLSHYGIDLRALSRAIIRNIRAKKLEQGGSTITQQLARSLLKDNSKTLQRKLREMLLAIALEQKYTKNEIIKLYLNNVYFGKNIFGIRTASLHYFKKEVNDISNTEILALITLLRGPNYYLANPTARAQRYKLLNQVLVSQKLITEKRKKKNINSYNKISWGNNTLPNIKTSTLKFVAKKIDNKTNKIFTTVNAETQLFISSLITKSKYPLTIVGFQKENIIGFGSTYGNDYPFLSKNNAGSTLKPFLYCYLRDLGMIEDAVYSGIRNEHDWPVREAEYHGNMLSLKQALYYSNNNFFINACYDYNIDSTLSYLANIFNKNRDEFYPSSLLGATKSGLSVYELAVAYATFFSPHNISATKLDCIKVLNNALKNKLNLEISNAFIKTGTTNLNKERYAILGNPEYTFAILRNENLIDDNTKDGNFLQFISREFKSFFKKNQNYRWI